MTATFGKLDRQTLTLKPGLNIIEAPNEWGKSTWCAFLIGMLYGIDTSQRTTQTVLADKEHYAPWSGQPMSGRLELSWNGKDITIERSTKGRIPMGEFSAYETASGLPVSELTATNCGQVLLGVERSVFLRAGFIRQTEMPIAQDEALRRRLNALVTTGDENNAADQLAEKLKDLKNRCRHNKTGALPQAEAQRGKLLESLSKLTILQEQHAQFSAQQLQLETQLAELKNHQLAMVFERSKEGLYRLSLAQDAKAAADARVQQLKDAVAALPEKQDLVDRLSRLRQLLGDKALWEQQTPPNGPAHHEIWGELSPEAALAQAHTQKAAWDRYQKPGALLPILSGLCLAAGIGLCFLWSAAWIPGLIAAALLLGIYCHQCIKNARTQKSIAASYGDIPPERWIPLAEAYVRQSAAAAAVSQTRAQQLTTLQQQLNQLTGGATPEEAEARWQNQLALHEELAQAEQVAQQAAVREADLRAAVKPAAEPAQPDTLTLSEEDTARQISLITAQLQQLQLRAGQCLGQIDSLGQETQLRQQLEAVEQRICKLQDLYEATVLALAHLEQAALQLQQRFAPQLTAKARELFATLTDGRYDRLLLDQQLQVQAAATTENSMHAARWRSDGTIDQLYLALRLAVAEQLTPHAPLVLDDTLVRFDDRRHQAAMKLLTEMAEHKQVLLFTCQSREGAYSPENLINI